MLVSEVAGTTVDAIDSQFERDGKLYTIIDTAGVRRRSRQKEDVEIIASFKSLDSIRRADIVLLVVDGIVGPVDQDAKLIQEILEAGKAVIVVGNKVDLAGSVKPEFRKSFREQADETFHFFNDVPLVFVSALTGSGIQDLFATIDKVWEKLNIDIPTSKLNEFFFDVIRLAPAPVYGTRDVKFYYLVQTNQRPPSFIAFVNFPDGVDNAYRRFLANRMKEHWDLKGIPIRIYAMKKGGRRLTHTTVATGHQRSSDEANV
jgi:GTP-binding protein